MKKGAIIALVTALVAALLVICSIGLCRAYVLAPYRIPTAGMFPSVKLGDSLWVFKMAYGVSNDVKRGDVIAYRVSGNGKNDVFLKRVVGIPGDKVRTAGSVVYINGTQLAQTPVGEQNGLSIFRESLDGVTYEIALSLGPSKFDIPDVDLTVPVNALFVLGDNRMNSMDSRFTGPISFSAVVGKKL